MTVPQIRKTFGLPMYENLESLADQMLDQEEERIRMEGVEKATENSTDPKNDGNQGDTGILVLDANSVEVVDKQKVEIDEVVSSLVDQAVMQAEKESSGKQKDQNEKNEEEQVAAGHSGEPDEKKR